MFDPADRRKQILYKAVAALARRERSRLGLYKKLSETFNEAVSYTHLTLPTKA